MSQFPSRVLLTAQRQNGVVTRQQLLNAGVSPRRIDGFVDRGLLLRLHRGVFAVAGSADTELRALTALCFNFERAVVGRTTAARLWTVRGISAKIIELIVPSALHLVIPNVLVYRSRSLSPLDVVTRSDGIRVTSPARTLFDLADVVSDSQLELMVEQCRREELVSPAALAAISLRLAARGRPGSGRFRDLLASTAGEHKPTQTDLEMHFLQAVRRADLPEPMRQCPLVLPSGKTIHFDFAYPDELLAIEIDGFGHMGRRAEARDRERDRTTASVGWMTMRFVGHQVWPDARGAVEQVATVLSARGGRTSA